MTVLISIVVILMVPVAGAIGTQIHESESARLAQVLTSRHPVPALVIADSAATAIPRSAGSLTRVRWTVGGAPREGVVQSLDWRKAGDTTTVWVDDTGERALAPPDISDPALRAAIVALTVWGGVATAGAGLHALLRSWLNRQRYAQWQREFTQFADGGGKRPHHG